MTENSGAKQAGRCQKGRSGDPAGKPPGARNRAALKARALVAKGLNSRQENFAQNLAKGMTKSEAYVSAGYKPDPGNPTRLTENDRVQKRVVELQKRAAIDTGITIQSVTADLAEVVKEASALPQSAGTLNARRAALMDIANLNGLIVSRNENGRPGDFSIADKIVESWKTERAAQKLDS